MKAPNSNFSGLRFINCKSGKDRTGMAASLEQIQILSREYDLAEHEYQKALDAMRRLVCNLPQKISVKRKLQWSQKRLAPLLHKHY